MTDSLHPPEDSLCIPGFGAIEVSRVLAQDDLFIVVRDKFPVSPGHTLIIARRPVSRFRDLVAEEKQTLLRWIDWSIERLQAEPRRPDAFNIGVNDGPAAGQTIPQLHWHIIPRYAGDTSDPRGGVRLVIPEKANYW
jgi:diadenosine tetraphosphate (Ap4A) HIT family hydrolase